VIKISVCLLVTALIMLVALVMAMFEFFSLIIYGESFLFGGKKR